MAFRSCTRPSAAATNDDGSPVSGIYRRLHVCPRRTAVMVFSSRLWCSRASYVCTTNTSVHTRRAVVVVGGGERRRKVKYQPRGGCPRRRHFWKYVRVRVIPWFRRSSSYLQWLIDAEQFMSRSTLRPSLNAKCFQEDKRRITFMCRSYVGYAMCHVKDFSMFFAYFTIHTI